MQRGRLRSSDGSRTHTLDETLAAAKAALQRRHQMERYVVGVGSVADMSAEDQDAYAAAYTACTSAVNRYIALGGDPRDIAVESEGPDMAHCAEEE